jgi:hypothetical protein
MGFDARDWRRFACLNEVMEMCIAMVCCGRFLSRWIGVRWESLLGKGGSELQ